LRHGRVTEVTKDDRIRRRATKKAKERRTGGELAELPGGINGLRTKIGNEMVLKNFRHPGEGGKKDARSGEKGGKEKSNGGESNKNRSPN